MHMEALVVKAQQTQIDWEWSTKITAYLFLYPKNPVFFAAFVRICKLGRFVPMVSRALSALEGFGQVLYSTFQ